MGPLVITSTVYGDLTYRGGGAAGVLVKSGKGGGGLSTGGFGSTDTKTGRPEDTGEIKPVLGRPISKGFGPKGFFNRLKNH